MSRRKPGSASANTSLTPRLVEDDPVPEASSAGIGEAIGLPEVQDEKPFPEESHAAPVTAPSPPSETLGASWAQDRPPVEDTPEALAAHLSPAESAPGPGPTVQDAPSGGGGSSKSKGRKGRDGVSAEDRAQAAFMGGAMLEQGLSFLAAMVGSNLTPRSMMEEQRTTAATRAAAGAGFSVLFDQPGVPLDVNPSALARADLRNVLVREVGVVLVWRDGQGWLPLRFTLGPPELSPEEKALALTEPESPIKRDGSLMVLTEPATIAHAIAAQLADGTDAATKALSEFIEKYQTEIRLAYAGVLLAWFMTAAWRDGAARR